MTDTIDVESRTEAEPAQAQTMAVTRRAEYAVSKPLSLEELRTRLKFIRDAMQQEMTEGQDYGKIPGTGDKPSLLQPGAQKLLLLFNLREQVLREVKTDFPNMEIPGHREYEFTITVYPAGQRPEDGWHGVGTCSTLESKYRYRKAERICPQCKKKTIIAENPKFTPAGQVPGFICWKKKGGCGTKFHDQHPEIINQPTGDTENEDPADCWNTVRKMAFKRALVAATINATNTSELWTQDLEDNATGDGAGKPQDKPGKPPATSTRPAPTAGKAPPPAQQSKPAEQPKFPTEATRTWLIGKLKDKRRTAEDYFCKLDKPAVLLPGEHLEDLPFEFLPLNRAQFDLLVKRIESFEAGGPSEHAFPAHPLPDEEKKKRAAKPKPSPAPADPDPRADPRANQPVAPAKKQRDPEWFWEVICPIPPRGMKKAEYLKDPETIGKLYYKMKAGDDLSQKRLWGFAKHWVPAPFTLQSGKTYPVTEGDLLFREALDDFVTWEERHGKDTPATEEEQRQADLAEELEKDDLPM